MDNHIQAAQLAICCGLAAICLEVLVAIIHHI